MIEFVCGGGEIIPQRSSLMRKHSLIVFFVLLLLLLLATVAFAQGGEKHVGLVVQFPDGVHTEIVTVPVDATTADVLAASTLNVGMADTDWGKAVCNINDVGSPTEDCFADSEHFWAYFHLDPGEKQWVVSDVGISGYTPEDKSVEGFAWSDFDANYAPKVIPPVKTFEDIQAASDGGAGRSVGWIVGLVLTIVAILLLLFYFMKRGKQNA
jgi:hypothetical protein